MKCLSEPKHKMIVNYTNIIIIFNYNDQLLIRMFLFYFQSKYKYKKIHR